MRGLVVTIAVLTACGRIGFSQLAGDGAGTGDGSGSGSGDAAQMMFHDLGQVSDWSVYDVSAQYGGAQGFLGGAFDGRYVYFVPNQYGVTPNGLVTRYDSQGAFTMDASWEAFDLTAVDGNAAAFCTGAFDGRYVYFIPGTGSTVARYDTQGAFATAASWSVFDLSPVNANAKAFTGAAFDGRYLYLVPNVNGLVVRYDTQVGFTTSTSWSVFDTSSVDANATKFSGAVLDGRYLYLVPGRFDVAVTARFDTTVAFTSASSWTVFDVLTVPGADTGFAGGAFDGRYVYFAPYYDNTVYQGVATRYDTMAAFGTPASWETFDLTGMNTNARGFTGASFDGRFVYLVENQFGAYKLVARYDTLRPFASGWALFDMTAIPNFRAGFFGAVFDGEYMYFVPYENGNNGVITRFDAKTPPSLPMHWNASFF